MTITLNNGDILPNFITILNDEFLIESNSESDIGSYMVMFSGCYNNSRGLYY